MTIELGYDASKRSPKPEFSRVSTVGPGLLESLAPGKLGIPRSVIVEDEDD